MTGRTVLITGVPRGGTTLACELLNLVPDTVALDEPLDPGSMPTLSEDVPRAVREFCEDMRRSLLEDGKAISRHVGGRVDGRKLSEAPRDSPRVWLAEHGSISVTKSLSKDFLLAIKHPAMFTACLGPLARHFPVYAVVRHPFAVLASWQTVPFPYRYGRMPGAERYDGDLQRRLWATEDRVDRQLLLLDWLFARYEQLPEGNVVRYEDIVSSGGSALAAVNEAARALNRPLVNRNRSYDPAQARELAERLLASGGAYWRFYPRGACA